MSLKQPVQYPVKYYSHADADAPQLASADGVIKTILKACLVTGYGTKEGARWTALFEDDFRIVLRRPLGTGSPPDIKIENGIINGAASHRIVSQDNPTGLDDATELAVVNFLTRDSRHGQEWHLIVSDFGFMLCYQMGRDGVSNHRNSILYVGGLKKMQDSNDEIFVANSMDQLGLVGYYASYLDSLFDTESFFKDMRTGVSYYSAYNFISFAKAETYYNNEYMASNIFFNENHVFPFLTAACTGVSSYTTGQISIADRSMLRFVNAHHTTTSEIVFYIPLDYWEL